MEFEKLSLDSPMAQANHEDDIFNDDDIQDEDLLREDNPVPAVVGHAQPEGHQAPHPESFAIPAEETYVCEYISSDTYKSHGTLLQFVNQNCADAASIIGAVRIPVNESHLLPAYLARHRQLVKRYAVRHLNRHLIETQSSAGATEKLCLDDYGMTYMLASVSKAGRTLPPSGRSEGPLQYCMYPKLNAPVTLYVNPDGTPERVHVINVYIHLYDVNRRRRAILERASKAEEAKVAAALAPPPPPQPQAVKRKNPGPPSTQASSNPSGAAAVPHFQMPVHLHNYNLPRRPPAPVANSAPAVWQPPPPPPVVQPPPPPVQENYPPMPNNHPQINWPASPKLPDFPPSSA